MQSCDFSWLFSLLKFHFFSSTWVFHLNLSLRARNSAITCTGSDSFRQVWIDASRTRMKGLVSFSSPIVDGIVAHFPSDCVCRQQKEHKFFLIKLNFLLNNWISIKRFWMYEKVANCLLSNFVEKQNGSTVNTHKLTFAQANFFCTCLLSGSTVRANRKLLYVYSCPQNTFCVHAFK